MSNMAMGILLAMGIPLSAVFVLIVVVCLV